MQMSRHFRYGIAVLVTFQIITSFGAIALLTRMGPAIERIRSENVYSIEAAEQMMAALAELPGDDAALHEQKFREALARCRRNVTEPEEVPALDQIEEHAGAAFEGDREARAAVIAAVARLSRVNHEAMAKAEQEAERLGDAGAWAAAFLAMASLIGSFWVVHAQERRLFLPLAEIYRALETFEAGDLYRKVRPTDGWVEIRRIRDAINRLLDRVGETAAPREGNPEFSRPALLHLLDRLPEPAFVIGTGGVVGAANRPGLDRLAQPQGERLKQLFTAVAGGEAPEADLRVEPIEPGRLWLCIVPT